AVACRRATANTARSCSVTNGLPATKPPLRPPARRPFRLRPRPALITDQVRGGPGGPLALPLPEGGAPSRGEEPPIRDRDRLEALSRLQFPLGSRPGARLAAEARRGGRGPLYLMTGRKTALPSLIITSK